MKHLKSYESFQGIEKFNYEGCEDLENLDEGLKEFGSKIKKKAQKVVGKLAGEISIDDAKVIAQKRFNKQIESAKRFDAKPENVEFGKKQQGDKYMSAEESLYKALSLNKNLKKVGWDKGKGIFRDAMNYGASGMGGGTVTGGGSR